MEKYEIELYQDFLNTQGEALRASPGEPFQPVLILELVLKFETMKSAPVVGRPTLPANIRLGCLLG
jgi:hypothetical protein